MQQVGKYQLIRKLATGGMAEVFLAKASGPFGFEKQLVLKRILPHLVEDPQFVEMFLAEAKLAARLNHANIVQIFDFGMENDAYFIAMEYVDGIDLRTLCQRALAHGSPLSYPIGIRAVSLACEGLSYAHELTDSETGEPLKLIHRDISPDNILVSRTGGVKVVDFGIAKAANAGHVTRSGILKGKLPYMAPEYILGEEIDARADIYALGVVLHEMVTGRRPYENTNEVLLARAVIEGSLPDVRTFRADVPEQLVQILSRALAKDRALRYANCRELHADLERFLYLYSDPVGALQITELLTRLSTPPSPEKAGASGARLPEHKLLLESVPREPNTRVSETMLAPPPVTSEVTQPDRRRRPDAHGVSSMETQLLAPTSQSRLPSLLVSEPLVPELSRESAAPLHVEVNRTAPRPANERERFSIPSQNRIAHEVASEDEIQPFYGWHRRYLHVWAPTLALVLVAMVGIASIKKAPSTDAREAPPPSPLTTAPVLPPAPAQAVEIHAAAATLQVRGDASTTPSLPSIDEPRPEAKAEDAQPTEAVTPSDSNGLARLRVTSSLIGDVFINDIKIGKTPLVHEMKPGTVRVKVEGKFQNHAFDKTQTVTLVAGNEHPVPFDIQKLTVTPRGRPDEMRVISFDDRRLQDRTQVTTYEGEHDLLVLHVPTDVHYVATCRAKPGDKLCRYFVTLRQ
ncbi:protein kinase [Myxococcaceae bacterium GXIMD 01537]